MRGSHLVAAVLLLGAATPVLAVGFLDACTGSELAVGAATAPLTTESSVAVNGTGASCYALTPAPSFPFRGRVTAWLSDGFNTASASQDCYMTGIPPELGVVAPLLGCEGVRGSSPALVPGPMTLGCRAEPLAGEVFAVGVYDCKVAFNN